MNHPERNDANLPQRSIFVSAVFAQNIFTTM